MERKIGEIFEYNGEWYQCVECTHGIVDVCKGCSFYTIKGNCSQGINDNILGHCGRIHRTDGNNVIFKRLEKIGETFSDYCSSSRIVYFQRYRCYQKPIIEGNIIWHWADDTLIDIDIEIKQKQEDMEEKNLLFTNFENTVGIEIKQNKEDMEEKTIKIKKEDIKVGSKVIYLPSNRPYVITEANCRMKYDGDWHDCVIYTPLYDNPYKCFVRPIKDFAQNFVLDSAEEKEEKHSNLENTGKNLKPFDLEAAKAGKPVCTRDGRNARIICFDAKDTQPIIGLYEKDIDGIVREYLCSYHMDGRMYDDHDCGYDLMMLSEKKEGWAVIIRSDIYETEEQAKEVLLNSRVGVMIRKIEWEE